MEYIRIACIIRIASWLGRYEYPRVYDGVHAGINNYVFIKNMRFYDRHCLINDVFEYNFFIAAILQALASPK